MGPNAGSYRPSAMGFFRLSKMSGVTILLTLSRLTCVISAMSHMRIIIILRLLFRHAEPQR